MSLSDKHPLYNDFQPDWEMLRDFYAGPRKVKDSGEKYLPPTEGMRIDGLKQEQAGWHAYNAYRNRARVPDYVKEAVEVMVGLLHQKDATIELPTQMEYLRSKASFKGEPLSALHRRITVEQITTGRVGLLPDLPRNPDPRNPDPYIALYAAEAITNWDDFNESGSEQRLNFVILDESGYRTDENFNWKEVKSYRVLQLKDSKYKTGTFGDAVTAPDFVEAEMFSPVLRGKELDYIPFTFINSKDLLPEPDEPPLKGLAELCMGIYQSEADYRQNLYMQAQDTLVVIGGVRNPNGVPGEPEALRTGAGARIDVDQGGDAKYIGVSADGLTEQRLAIENDRKRAEMKAGELIQNNGSQMESGKALSTRFNAQTATLNQIAMTAAAGLEKSLRDIAVWIGADPAAVKVTPNTEFIDFGINGTEFKALMEAKRLGFPISLQSLHALAADRGVTLMDYVTEMAQIAKDDAEMLKREIEKAQALTATQPTPAQPAQGSTAKPPATDGATE